MHNNLKHIASSTAPQEYVLTAGPKPVNYLIDTLVHCAPGDNIATLCGGEVASTLVDKITPTTDPVDCPDCIAIIKIAQSVTYIE